MKPNNIVIRLALIISLTGIIFGIVTLRNIQD
jgi:hypothetical protein